MSYNKVQFAIFIATFAIFFSECAVATVSLVFEGPPRNCDEVQADGSNQSGVYTIFPPGESSGESVGVEVYCDMVTDGGGWTVIQRRRPPLLIHVDFERTWQEYANGFGILIDNHWLGLDVIAELTKVGDSVLRIDMTDWDDELRVAEYNYFKVANGSQLYKLSVSGYSGDAGDSLAGHDGRAFTTKDRDNDIHPTRNCAQSYHGAWWYNACHTSHLNGIYIENGRNVTYAQGISWLGWQGYYYSLERAEMKIRSRHFKTSDALRNSN